MRAIGWLLLVLLAVGYVATEVPEPCAPQWAPAEDTWRRTSEGWQRATWLADPTPSHGPRLHPAVVAMFELLVSAAALVAFAPLIRDDKAGRDSGRNSIRSHMVRRPFTVPSA